jgi:hypothetical protein
MCRPTRVQSLLMANMSFIGENSRNGLKRENGHMQVSPSLVQNRRGLSLLDSLQATESFPSVNLSSLKIHLSFEPLDISCGLHAPHKCIRRPRPLWTTETRDSHNSVLHRTSQCRLFFSLISKLRLCVWFEDKAVWDHPIHILSFAKCHGDWIESKSRINFFLRIPESVFYKYAT